MSSRPVKIGLLGAIPEEVAHTVEAIRVERSTEIGLRSFYEGVWHDRSVVAVFSRIGKVSAAVTATLLIEHFGITHLLFTGVAGGIGPGLRIGDVILADRLVQHDLDASPIPIFKRFEVPLLGKIDFETDRSLLELAEEASHAYSAKRFEREIGPDTRAAFSIEQPRVHRGLVASGDQFLNDPIKAAELRSALPGLLGVEMEGAAVAQVCYELGNIPLSVVRIVSDAADSGAHLDYQRFIDELAGTMARGIVEEILDRLS